MPWTGYARYRMSYAIPEQVNFQLTGTPYVRNLQVADFSLDGKPLVFYAPPPGLLISTSAPWDTGASSQTECSSAYDASRIVQACRSQSSHDGKVLEAAWLGLFWNQVTKSDSRVGFSHGQGNATEQQKFTGWDQPPAKDYQSGDVWLTRLPVKDDHNVAEWNHPPATDITNTGRFFRVNLYASKPDYFSGYMNQPPLNFSFAGLHYTPATTPAAWFSFGSTTPDTAVVPTDNRKSTRYASNRTQDNVIRLPWGFGSKAKDEDYEGRYGGEKDPELTEKPEPSQPDIRESYLLMNTVSIVTLPDRTPVDLRNINIQLDIDSFSWSFSGELWGATSLALVEPDQDGVKQVEVNVNGWVWVFIVERYTGDRRFGQERYTVYGTSRTQLLATPYAPLRSKSSTSELNAKQAISEELTNTGFIASYPSLNDYSTPDWIIPGGSFSYQNQTAMQVIVRLASTAGSVVIPAKESDVLNIQPRYPASPWAWGSATMDKIVPESLVIALSASWRPEPQYNSVYVSGTHAGVAVDVKRAGTAGNQPAPDIFEDWLTETQVNTERGRNELAKGGNQSITTLEIPLTDKQTAPGLIEPGQLVEIQDISGDWQGLCLSTSIRAEVGRVTQVIELERHYGK